MRCSCINLFPIFLVGGLLWLSEKAHVSSYEATDRQIDVEIVPSCHQGYFKRIWAMFVLICSQMDSSSLILWHVTNEALWDGDDSDSERLQWNELYTAHQWHADSNKYVSAIDTAVTCLLKRFGKSLITETLLLDLHWENYSPLTSLVISWMWTCLGFSMTDPWAIISKTYVRIKPEVCRWSPPAY